MICNKVLHICIACALDAIVGSQQDEGEALGEAGGCQLGAEV